MSFSRWAADLSCVDGACNLLSQVSRGCDSQGIVAFSCCWCSSSAVYFMAFLSVNELFHRLCFLSSLAHTLWSIRSWEGGFFHCLNPISSLLGIAELGDFFSQFAVFLHFFGC